MEPDGITRVYCTSAERAAWLRFPEKTHHDSRLQGPKAEEVLSRVDFRCVSVMGGIPYVREWAVYPKPEGKRFVVDRRKWDWDEDDSKLAEHLEKLTGKTGLTIVVS